MKPAAGLSYQKQLCTNGVVIDPFGGSGSTLMACAQTDRICRTMELDPRYASVIVLRYKTEYPDDNNHVLRNGQELSFEQA